MFWFFSRISIVFFVLVEYFSFLGLFKHFAFICIYMLVNSFPHWHFKVSVPKYTYLKLFIIKRICLFSNKENWLEKKILVWESFLCIHPLWSKHLMIYLTRAVIYLRSAHNTCNLAKKVWREKSKANSLSHNLEIWAQSHLDIWVGHFLLCSIFRT